MSRKDYFQLKAGIEGHSMLITGVHIGEDGMPKRWKILNSYNTNGLHGGYFVCWKKITNFCRIIGRKNVIEATGGYTQQDGAE